VPRYGKRFNQWRQAEVHGAGEWVAKPCINSNCLREATSCTGQTLETQRGAPMSVTGAAARAVATVDAWVDYYCLAGLEVGGRRSTDDHTNKFMAHGDWYVFFGSGMGSSLSRRAYRTSGHQLKYRINVCC
jgi:hypothetical protein